MVKWKEGLVAAEEMESIKPMVRGPDPGFLDLLIAPFTPGGKVQDLPVLVPLELRGQWKHLSADSAVTGYLRKWEELEWAIQL